MAVVVVEAEACVAVSVSALVQAVSTVGLEALLPSVVAAVFGHAELEELAGLVHLVVPPDADVVELRWRPEQPTAREEIVDVLPELEADVVDVALVDVVLVGVAERRRHQQTKTNLTKNWIHS